jgi:hypothetical protein
MAASNDELIATYDCERPFDVSSIEKPPPEVPRYDSQASALALEAEVQRCESSKSSSTCNVLDKIRRSRVLRIEPLPQFAFSGDSGKRGAGKLILEEFYSGAERTDVTNPTQGSKQPIPDPLYRAWGPQFFSAWPARTEATGTVHGTTCGMHCFTQIVRHLQKEGETKTIYDKMVDGLKPRDEAHKATLQESAPVMTSAALKADPSLKPIFDIAKTEKRQALWDASLKPYYKYWYPIMVLWWVRANEGTTWRKDGWTKRKDMIISKRGIFLWQRFSEWSKKPKKDPPPDADEIAKAKVPKLLKDLGLCMKEGERKGRVKQAIRETMEAIDEGYPVVTLRPGHFVLIIGYVEDEAGLRFVINDSGRNPIQYFIDPYIPHTIEGGGKKKVSGELVVRDPKEPEKEWRQGPDMAACKKQLQDKGLHIVEDGVELPLPAKWSTKTIKPKDEEKKRPMEVKQVTFEFEYDWKHTCFWWNDYWILKFADGKQVDKRLQLKAEAGSTAPAPASP